MNDVSSTTHSVVDRYKTAHLWIGLVDPHEYAMYFDQQDEISSFGEDLHMDYEYDEDFIIIFEPLKEPVTIHDLIKEIPLYDENERTNVINKCSELQLDAVNAFVFYSDPDLKVAESYRGLHTLHYIGHCKAEH